MEVNKLSGIIVDAAYKIHRDVGPGLLESVYEILLADALTARGLRVARQVAVPIHVDNRSFDEGFRADLVVEGLVIVEIKSVEHLAPVHKKQVLTYLKFSGIHVGLLINFSGELLKGNIERIVTVEAPDLKNWPPSPIP
jgi:iron complex transport system substrate-binding protein